MIRSNRTEPSVTAPGVARPPAGSRPSSPLDVLLLSLCCGLAAGLIEVVAQVITRLTGPSALYTISRHFVWLVPLSNLFVFAAIGTILALATKLWPRRAGGLSTRVLGACTVLPMLMVVGPRIYAAAWWALLLGIASLLIPALERRTIALRWSLIKVFPCLLGVVLVLASWTFGRDWLKQRREAARAVPAATMPNVLLIVLDTVRADHMSLYGYPRATTPVLERLAKRGILFDQARATAPWTLPSHASMFTGRWPHELGVKWLTPLGGNSLTLAEYLGSHGYATAGFAANTLYCSYATGLDRGFTHYEDYDLERLGAFRTGRLMDLSLKTIADMGQRLSQSVDMGPFRPLLDETLGRLVVVDKKHAEVINQEFVDWLRDRPGPGRPFFAFLNYYDVHSRYLLPRGAEYRFGLSPWTPADRELFERWIEVDKLRLPAHYRTLIKDCYDSCLSYLDMRLGELFDELQVRGVLDQTLVIVTSDHGEGLGEHDLFDHGESLYQTELGVPLLIVPPARSRHQGRVREMVSLRDLPATIADLVGLGTGSPFPGQSLAGRWQDLPPELDRTADDGALSELADRNPGDPNQGRSPAARGPLVSLAEGDFVYIRNEGDGSEELFDERDDPRELLNRAHVDVMQPHLRRFRARLDQMKAGSLKRAR